MTFFVDLCKACRIIRKWDESRPKICPSCGKPIIFKQNDGIKRIVFLDSVRFIVTNYYQCTDPSCVNHVKFTMAPLLSIPGRKYGLDVWAKVVRFHFKTRLSYNDVSALMLDEYHIKISPSTVRTICQYFEAAGAKAADERTLELVRENGRIILSIDGTGDSEGGPGLWILSDRVTGRVLYATVLEHATVANLGRVILDVKATYGVEISYVISDRQDTIVKAVSRVLKGVPHQFCHYHFLKNLAKPVIKRDNVLLTKLKSKVKGFNLVAHARDPVKGEQVTRDSSVHVILRPLSDELLNAVATTGDGIERFPGLEAYANLEHVLKVITPMLARVYFHRVMVSLLTIKKNLAELLDAQRGLNEEIKSLVEDFNRIRHVLGQRGRTPRHVRAKADTWAKMLRGRLKRSGLQDKPSLLKSKGCKASDPVTDIYHEWSRLYHTHRPGLFAVYGRKDAEFTNNPVEWTFRDGRSACRKRFGRGNTGWFYIVHGKNYCKIDQLDLSESNVKCILVEADGDEVIEGLAEMKGYNKRTRRTWRIRDKDTGNMKLLEERLMMCLAS